MLNPGIVRLVGYLNSHGFVTCDSGDGETHDFKCDREYPYIVIESHPDTLVADADRLWYVVKHLLGVNMQPISMDSTPAIQATYDPSNRLCFVDLMFVADKNIDWECVKS